MLAAVVNTDGMLVRTRIFEGNTGDCTTMQQIMASLVKEQIRKGKNNFKFITVARSTGIKYKSAGEGIQTVLDNKKQEIRLEKVKVEGSTDSYLLVDSKAKTLKERSMYDRSCAYFEEGLKAIQNGIEKKGGTKAHLNLAVLAYWVASTVRYQLKRKDIHHSWSEIVRILQTHKVVSTRVTKEDVSTG